MRKLLPGALLSALLLSAAVALSQTPVSNSNSAKASTRNTNVNRKPIFRATADQIKQAQAILKQRSFYGGDQTGKLDAPTRAGLKQYQQAEGLKETGTLNRVTLEKMGITLTEKQRGI